MTAGNLATLLPTQLPTSVQAFPKKLTQIMNDKLLFSFNP